MLVKRLVEMHGGRVEARSDGMGKGSEFTILLPDVVIPETDSKSPEDEDSGEKSPVRYLVVDDNRDVAYVMTKLLHLHGNTAKAVYSGEEALAEVAEFRPDVILLDIALPQMSGYEICRHLRQLPGGQDLLIIAQSGWGSPKDRQQSMAAGFDHHLVKPVEMKSLLKMVQESGRG
jgi:hypothetical protein